MIKSLILTEVSQPIGTFYVGKMKSDDLMQISRVERREKNKGIQRELSDYRVNEIARYCDDPDATFPTPIILSIVEKDLVKLEDTKDLFHAFGLDNDVITQIAENFGKIIRITYNDDYRLAEVLDGQHRLEGIKRANTINIELPIVVMFDLTEEEKAYIFSTINSNQTKVDKSLIYDLFELSTKRSPLKTCHEIARVMNLSNESPFKGKLKMLGKRKDEGELLSQGTFVEYLVGLISGDPKSDMIDYKNGSIPKKDSRYVLRDYFLDNRDDIILKLLYLFFGQVKEVFPNEWNNSKYILSKTTGYGAMLKLFREIIRRGQENGKINQDIFKEYLLSGQNALIRENLRLTSEHFASNDQTQTLLANYFIKAYEKESMIKFSNDE